MRREIPCESATFDVPTDCPGPDSVVLMEETREAVASAVGRLPERRRRLIEMAYHDTAADYRSLAHSMEMPIGSVGPTRQRALRWLRTQLTDAGFGDTP